MKKIINIVLILSILLVGCYNNNGGSENMNNEVISNEEYETIINSDELLTVEQLLQLTGIDKDEYEESDIQRYINICGITGKRYKEIEDVVVENLGYYVAAINAIDVSDIYSGDFPIRESNYTEDVVAIAYYENINIDTTSRYYDLENDLMYKKSPGDVFKDLNDGEKSEFKDGKKMLEKLEELGVFEWESVNNAGDMLDPTSYSLAIKYSDGSVYRFYIYGYSYGDLPADKVYEMRQLLLGVEEDEQEDN